MALSQRRCKFQPSGCKNKAAGVVRRRTRATALNAMNCHAGASANLLLPFFHISRPCSVIWWLLCTVP